MCPAAISVSDPCRGPSCANAQTGSNKGEAIGFPKKFRACSSIATIVGNRHSSAAVRTPSTSASTRTISSTSAVASALDTVRTRLQTVRIHGQKYIHTYIPTYIHWSKTVRSHGKSSRRLHIGASLNSVLVAELRIGSGARHSAPKVL